MKPCMKLIDTKTNKFPGRNFLIVTQRQDNKENL